MNRFGESCKYLSITTDIVYSVDSSTYRKLSKNWTIEPYFVYHPTRAISYQMHQEKKIPRCIKSGIRSIDTI